MRGQVSNPYDRRFEIIIFYFSSVTLLNGRKKYRLATMNVASNSRRHYTLNVLMGVNLTCFN
jgi:hypothetical protein